MDLKAIAAEILMKKMGDANDQAATESALSDLLGSEGSFDLGKVVDRFADGGGDITSKLNSWLGDNDNESISAEQMTEVIGKDKVEDFAKNLGVNVADASSGLSEMLPQLIDMSSRGGKLLESLGGSSGLAGLASKFLK